MAEEFMEPFNLLWNSEQFSSERKMDMINTSNLMLKKRVKAFPYFSNYIQCMKLMVETQRADVEYKDWVLSLNALIKRPNANQFNQYVEMTLNLLKDKTIYKSPSTEWKITTSDFKFEFGEEPIVRVGVNDLFCYANKDSSTIFGTKGVYYPIDDKWIGSGGKITWERAGLSPDSVYAEIDNYVLQMTTYKFEIDTVRFYNKKFFPDPLIGSLEEKILAAVKSPDKATYPRFSSFSKKLIIDNLFENINFVGGFSMNGPKLFGTGTSLDPAIVTILRENNDKELERFIILKSENFIITNEKFSSSHTAARIYLDQDSIYHPGVLVKYMDENKELSLLREKKGISKAPFFDTYHQMDLYCEAIYWKTDEPKMDFSMFRGISNTSEALFESMNFYDETRYEKLRGMDAKHPLEALKDYSDLIGSKVVDIESFAAHMRAATEEIEGIMVKLACQGFLIYDFEKKQVKLEDRLVHFINSRKGKTDYDIIQVVSTVTRDNNASMNLLNFDMTMKGVMEIHLSDSHNVVIYPYGQEIYMKKNRDFDFMGEINAGLYEFHGKDFNFLYDDFKINLNGLDSTTYKVRDKEPNPETGEYELHRIKTMIEGINGELLLDKPNNKSGLKPFKEYPKLISDRESYVFYDKLSIWGGVYDRSNFYFMLDPFTLDSLDNLNTDQTKLGGSFVSAGIFPDFEDSLCAQKDYSLGFIRPAPVDGFQTYGGKGTYYNTIKLSEEGLHGDGKLEYLTSTSLSNDFVFFPDSMRAPQVYDFVILEQEKDPEYPPVNAKNVDELWLPYEEVMSVTKVETPINFFKYDEGKLHGSAFLSPLGVNGTGTIDFPTAQIDAMWFRFKHHNIDSDTCDFRMKASDLEDIGLSTFDYEGHVDLQERIGEFTANSDMSRVEFPVNQYICYMDQFTWHMDKAEIDLSISDKKKDLTGEDKEMQLEDGSTVKLSGSRFVSMHPDQDSLEFYSPSAKYYTKKNLIQCYDVAYILVADAAIMPDSGKVTILKRAEMTPFVNAKILANTATKYHNFYNVSARIFSKKKYVGSGNCDYVDENKTKQMIYFDNITVDTTYQTFAMGEIDEAKDFTLSPQYKYYGKVKLTANNRNYFFDGNGKIDHECTTLPRFWFKFVAEINPDEIYIPIVEDLDDREGNKFFAGVFHFTDSSRVYSAFLAPKDYHSDEVYINSFGYLYYDKGSGDFQIGSMERFKENKNTGNYVVMNKFCDVLGEGKINMSENIDEDVQITSYGNILNKTKKNSARVDVVMAVDFFFNDKNLKMMADILKVDDEAKSVNLGRDVVSKAFVQILGMEEADKIVNEIALSGTYKRLPDNFVHTFFLTDIKFNWNQVSKSWISDGDIGISNIGKDKINKSFKGFVEIEKRRSGDIFNIYIVDKNGTWYFFYYQRGIMSVLSSDREWNKVITEMKPDDRTVKGKKGKKYSFQLTQEKRKKDFLKSMGVEEE
ncbi:MAG: hypothetical protein KKD31_17870 [Bacteroidetes bacterium]|nr:hypothetical protein [Bacteroidota bacterium]